MPMENRELLQAKSFINNEWIGHSTTNIISVVNRYDQTPLANVVCAEASEVQFAMANSVQGFQTYSKWTAAQRSEVLLKIRDALKLEREKFVNILVTEAGKPIDAANAEIERSLTVLTMAASEALKIGGEVIPMDFGAGVGKTAATKKFPIGPILAISPFNFPLNLVLHKLAPALAAGCSVILKPSAYTPLTALALATLCKKAGLPAGVLNVVICQNEEAALMLKDERLKMLSFTGSAEVGWSLKAQAGKKKVTLELGGNAAVIVDRTADLEMSSKAIATGAFSYSGQVCISVQRIYVDELVFDEFIEKFLSHAKEIKAGNPAESGVIVGPMIEKKHLERVDTWVKEALSEGAVALLGGTILDEEHNIYSPTLLTNTKREMKVVCEEAFAPLAIIEKVKYFDEAIREINRSKYGLQASLFTNQISQMKYAFENIEAGAVIINAVPGFRIDTMPYGGVKDSGLGREGIKYTIEDMMETRLLVY